MKAALILLAGVAPVAALAHGDGAYDRLPPATATSSWVCNAYGYGGHGGGRNTWQTVTGSYERSREAARDSARNECFHRGLIACGGAGCWPD